MVLGGTLQVLGLGGGITGAFLGGTPGRFIVMISTVPTAAGGGLVMMGAALRGRYQAWYDPRDLLARARTARRVGWSLMGVGLGLFVGSGIAVLAWPLESNCADEGCGLRYPKAFVAVGSGFLLGQLMISSSASALAWSFSYSEARARRVELTPTLGGLSMRF